MSRYWRFSTLYASVGIIIKTEVLCCIDTYWKFSVCWQMTKQKLVSTATPAYREFAHSVYKVLIKPQIRIFRSNKIVFTEGHLHINTVRYNIKPQASCHICRYGREALHLIFSLSKALSFSRSLKGRWTNQQTSTCTGRHTDGHKWTDR
jgi:hypothetical protein